MKEPINPLTRQHLAALSAGDAGNAAYRIFCAPALYYGRGGNYRVLSERARFHLRNTRRERLVTSGGEVQTYVFEPDSPARATVLIGHGWSAEAAFMSVLAEPMRRAGIRAVLFDLPAHGLSAGRSVNMVDCAKATLDVGQHFGPLLALVAHSFGGMIAMMAIEGRPPLRAALDVRNIVLLSCPDSLGDLTGKFADHWRLPPDGLRAFEHRLEWVGRRKIGDVTAAGMLNTAGCRPLVIHSRDDADVPYSCAERIVRDVPGAIAMPVDGLGHRNILFAPPVMRSIVKHLTGLLAEAPD